MGSYSNLYFDRTGVDWVKNAAPSECAVLFARSEYKIKPKRSAHPLVKSVLKSVYGGAYEPYYYLISPADRVRRRLSIHGYTEGAVHGVWRKALDERIADVERDPYPTWVDFNFLLATLKNLKFENWKEIRRTFGPAGRPDPKDNLESYLVYDFLDWCSVDSLAQIALDIDACRPNTIWADLTDVYISQYYDPDMSPHDEITSVGAHDYAYTKIIVATEGKTDSNIISAALDKMYPEYADLYSFMDFDGFKVEGGASPLARMIKGLAGAGIRARVVGLFDNDAVGREALASISCVQFPKHIVPKPMPDSAIARSYPTLGPEGLRRLDVNGTATSIEMFLGRTSLMAGESQLQPIRWTEWRPRFAIYQGEVSNKAAIQKTFFEELSACPSALAARQKFRDMDALLNDLFKTFS